MTLDRDFEREQETGVCSYCGELLPIEEWPDGKLCFGTCPSCDDYDQETELDNWWIWFEDDDYGAE
jgi:hypothetical protein